MKRRWIVPLLLLSGMVSIIVLTDLLTQISYRQYDSKVTTETPITEESPITSPNSPVVSEPRSLPFPPSPTILIPSIPSRPTLSLEPAALESADAAVKNALDKLPQGEVYHNVPEQMKVNVAEIIEAGIAPGVTEKIKQELQGKGQLEIQSNIPFDPSGMEMKLIVKPDEFEVFEVKGGKQFVTTSTPGKWVWEVTPLQAGDQLIVVKAIVDLKVPELDVTRPVEVEVFRATRTVQVNPVHSVSQFVSSNWREITGLVIGSGSLMGLISWWNGKKVKQAG